MEFSSLISRTGKGAPYIGEILDRAFVEAAAVIALLTPDDEAQLRSELRKRTDPAFEKRLTGQPRPNVLFEAGMAMGKMPDKTIFVEVGSVRIFSDTVGRHFVKLKNDDRTKRDPAARLKAVGCEIDDTGSDWLANDPAFNGPKKLVRKKKS